MHRKGWGTCRSPKSYNLSLDCPPCLVLFKMADKISMSQRYISDSDISLTMFIFYFGVEMLEQSVKLSRLIIFYFICNFLLLAPFLPNREPKIGAFCSAFVFGAVFQLLYSCCGRKSKSATNASNCGFCSKLVQRGSKFCAIQMAHLIGSQ